MEIQGKRGFEIGKFPKIGVAPIDDKLKSLEMVWSCAKESDYNQWERVRWFKLRERKKVEEDLK